MVTLAKPRKIRGANGSMFSSWSKMKNVHSGFRETLGTMGAFFLGVLEPYESTGNIYKTQKNHLYRDSRSARNTTLFDLYLKNATADFQT
jgi:hypothetical protein